MADAPSTTTINNTVDDCTICLSALVAGTPLLTLSCTHKFHFQCLAFNIKAKNKECPLCRANIDDDVVQLLQGSTQIAQQQQPVAMIRIPSPLANIVPSVEDPVDENVARELFDRFVAARQTSVAEHSTTESLSLITASTTLEYGAQLSNEESNIYGLVTLQAPNIISPAEINGLLSSHIPIDLVCVVDKSGSMSGEKIALLRQTLIYIVEQMNALDRLAVISFNTEAFDCSHGLKRMNEQNKQIVTDAINNNIKSNGGTYIGKGLEMGINLLTSRQTKNSLSALFLLTDGQDNDSHDYTQLIQTLPIGVQCHTFGYGPDHTSSLLVQLAEQGNGGIFTYIDEERAIGPAFAMSLGGLFTCVAQQVRINMEFTGDYKVTCVHAKYKHEPEQLPTTTLTVHLYDLNAEEKRNLVFQLHVPKMEQNEQNIEMTSQQPMSLSQSSEQIQQFENEIIGNATITYIETNSGRTINMDSIPFKLVRGSNLPNDLLQVNYELDIQRNRVDTAHTIEQAMNESNYYESRAILRAQVDKIKASISANDPFCQKLIKDLEYRYPTERAYRSSQQNACISHRRERCAYMPSSNISTRRYVNKYQTQMAANFENKKTS